MLTLSEQCSEGDMTYLCGVTCTFLQERDEFKIIFVDTPGITSRTAEEHQVFDEIETAGSLYQAFILVNDGFIREEGVSMLFAYMYDYIMYAGISSSI